MVMTPWSEDEVRRTVADYFDMLEAELGGVEFNKAEHRRALRKHLLNRSDAAVELKHQNISAVLLKQGLPYINGYKPRGHFQELLEQEVFREIEVREITGERKDIQKLPFSSFSWEVLSDDVAVKKMDKSAFLHHGTGVPRNVASFFGHIPLSDGKDITLVYDGNEFPARLAFDPKHRVRIFWRQDLSEIIITLFPEVYSSYTENKEIPGAAPEMRFSKSSVIEYGKYVVSFYAPDQVVLDCEYPDEQEPSEARREGALKQKTTTFYERDPKNRMAAVRFHGTKCKVCDFDFGKFYGEHGKDYIEIHHIVPLSEMSEAREVDPKNDLLPVCANCHRMIHRKKGQLLSIKDLRNIVRQNENDNG